MSVLLTIWAGESGLAKDDFSRMLYTGSVLGINEQQVGENCVQVRVTGLTEVEALQYVDWRIDPVIRKHIKKGYRIPRWGLRRYGTEQQIVDGTELSVQDFEERLIEN